MLTLLLMMHQLRVGNATRASVELSQWNAARYLCSRRAFDLGPHFTRHLGDLAEATHSSNMSELHVTEKAN